MRNLWIVMALGAAVTAGAAEKWARPELVEKVARGELKEARASWWGFDAADSTPYLRAALASKASTLTLDRQDGPWVTKPIWGRSDLRLVIPEGVELLAKRGEYRKSGDTLLRFDCATNVVVTGGGTIRMWFEDYTNRALYAWSEWRHAVALASCRNVTIENLSVVDSGGDGLYLGRSGRGGCNEDVVVRNVRFTRHNRQGISVITADRLLIERCVMENTCGTLPMAGIDFEPNGPDEMLRQIRVRDCVSRGNLGSGFDFSVGNLNSASPAISIVLENCLSEGNRNATKIHHGANIYGGFHGAVEFRNCTFADLDPKLDNFTSPTGKEPMSVTLLNCRAADPSRNGQFVPIGPEYGWGAVERPKWPDGSELKAVDWTPAELRAAKIRDAAPGRRVKTGFLPARGDADYIVHAAAPGEVSFTAEILPIGKSALTRCQIEVLDLDNRRLTTLNVPPEPRRVLPVSFTAPKAGFYRLSMSIKGSHVFAIREIEAPMALVATRRGRMTGWDGFAGTAWFRVPSGCRRFAFAASGGGGTELVHARLRDPSGQLVWDRDNIGSSEAWLSPENPAPGLWKIESLRATRGCLDDYGFVLREIPYVLFLSPEKTWEM